MSNPCHVMDVNLPCFFVVLCSETTSPVHKNSRRKALFGCGHIWRRIRLLGTCDGCDCCDGTVDWLWLLYPYGGSWHNCWGLVMAKEQTLTVLVASFGQPPPPQLLIIYTTYNNNSSWINEIKINIMINREQLNTEQPTLKHPITNSHVAQKHEYQIHPAYTCSLYALWLSARKLYRTNYYSKSDLTN